MFATSLLLCFSFLYLLSCSSHRASFKLPSMPSPSVIAHPFDVFSTKKHPKTHTFWMCRLSVPDSLFIRMQKIAPTILVIFVCIKFPLDSNCRRSYFIHERRWCCIKYSTLIYSPNNRSQQFSTDWCRRQDADTHTHTHAPTHQTSIYRRLAFSRWHRHKRMSGSTLFYPRCAYTQSMSLLIKWWSDVDAKRYDSVDYVIIIMNDAGWVCHVPKYGRKGKRYVNETNEGPRDDDGNENDDENDVQNRKGGRVMWFSSTSHANEPTTHSPRHALTAVYIVHSPTQFSLCGCDDCRCWWWLCHVQYSNYILWLAEFAHQLVSSATIFIFFVQNLWIFKFHQCKRTHSAALSIFRVAFHSESKGFLFGHCVFSCFFLSTWSWSGNILAQPTKNAWTNTHTYILLLAAACMWAGDLIVYGFLLSNIGPKPVKVFMAQVHLCQLKTICFFPLVRFSTTLSSRTAHLEWSKVMRENHTNSNQRELFGRTSA